MIKQKPPGQQKGVTLVELMITVAILSLIVGIAVPAYKGYIRESNFAAMRSSMNGLRTLIEDFRLDNGNYGTPGNQFTFPPGRPTANPASLFVQYGWDPSGNISGHTYTVAVRNGTTSYDVWATHVSGAWSRCDDRFNTCCEGSGTVASSCP